MHDVIRTRDGRLRLGTLRRWRGARSGWPPGNLPLIALRQWRAERRARRLGSNFRTSHNDDALGAYVAMSPALFAAVNARQAWANWRTIPATLHGRAPCRPLRVLDLACGDGSTCAVLAHHCLPGSRIIGLEFANRLVERANARTYHHADGSVAAVQVMMASILDPFIDEHGHPLADASIDWINCSGALVHHFNPDQLMDIAAECARVLMPGGWAAVDTDGRRRDDAVRRAFRSAGLRSDARVRSCLVDRYPQTCFRKAVNGHG